MMNLPLQEPTNPTILVVDDCLENLRLLSNLLTKHGYQVRCATQGKRAITAAELLPPDLILLDVMMPEMNGYEVCECLKSLDKTRDLPVIFLSALNETLDKVKAFAVGGVDYITKPFEVEEVLARIQTHLHFAFLQRCLAEQNERLQQQINDRQLLEKKLRSSEAEIRVFFESMNDLVLLIDTRDYSIKVAPTNLTRFYPNGSNILSQTIEQFYGANAEVFQNQVEQALESQNIINFEYSLVTDNTPLWFTASITPTSDRTVAWVARDISDRKQVEMALRQSEERWQLALRGNHDGIWDYNPVTQTVLYSSRSKEILGYSGTEISDRLDDFMAHIHPEDICWVKQALQDHLDGKIPYYNTEFRARCKDGSYKWILSRGQALWDEAGKPIRMVGSHTDITDRKQREEALRLIVEGTAATTGHEFFRSCVRYLAQVLRVRYAVVTKLLDRDRTTIRTLAYWTGEDWNEDIEYGLAGTPCEQVLAGQCCYYPDRVQECFPNDSDLKILGVVSYLGIPLTDSSGQVLGHLAVLDVKPMINEPSQQLILRIFAARAGAELERQFAEEALQRRAQMDSLLSEISRAFLDQEIDTAIGFTLRTLRDYTGSDRSYILHFFDNQKDCSITHEECAEGIPSSQLRLQPLSIQAFPWLHSQLRQGKPAEIFNVGDLPAGTIADRPWLERLSVQSLINIPMFHRSRLVGAIGLATVQAPKTWSTEAIELLKRVGELVAISWARHEAEIAQQRAAEMAFAASKAKSEFLANMSHELRTPLTAILGLSEALRDEVFGPLTAKQHQKLATIEQSGQHLLELINDVLDLAKIESGKMELQSAPTDISGLCEASLAFVRQQAYQKQIKLSSQIPPHIGKVEVDERRMRQVLINLLSNAVKFTPEGGHVWIEVRGDSSNEVLQFTVVDTGIGIAPENISKLFQPFVQLDSSFTRRYAGTGLGLALVRQVVELHGGSVALESEVGSGSRFTVALPWKVETEKPLAPIPSVSPVALTLNRVLIVEDSPPAAEQVAHYLLELGVVNSTIHSLGTGTVEVALDLNPDAIILDLQLPDRTGWDVLAQLKAEPRTQNIPVLIVSVVDEPPRMADRGSYEYLVKPFSRHQFQLALRKLAAASLRSETTLRDPLQQPLILLAEDSELNVSMIVEYLEARGYSIATAVNGREAVQMTKQLKPDLLLADIQMPEMDGFEAIRQIRADGQLAHIPIIALTSLAMPGDREKCLEAGANEYLAKPVSLKKLALSIAQLLNNAKVVL